MEGFLALVGAVTIIVGVVGAIMWVDAAVQWYRRVNRRLDKHEEYIIELRGKQ